MARWHLKEDKEDRRIRHTIDFLTENKFLNLLDCGKGKHELRVTSSNTRVTSSNPGVRRVKARVGWLKVRVTRLKAQVKRLKAQVGAIKPRVR